MADIAALTARNGARWAAAKLTRAAEFAPVGRRLLAAKTRYQAVAALTGVPWFVIAVIHQRESTQDFSRSLAQGDPWDRRSTHVPKGRGPFKSWEEAAVDALANCPPYASRWKDWSPAGTMTLLERYNGLAYANAGVPSPYLWSGTDQYKSGKITRDHGPIEPVVDKQLGCAGLIMAMMAIDPSIAFADASATAGKPRAPASALPRPAAPFPPPPDIPKPKPLLPQPQTSWFSVLLATILGAFRR